MFVIVSVVGLLLDALAEKRCFTATPEKCYVARSAIFAGRPSYWPAAQKTAAIMITSGRFAAELTTSRKSEPQSDRLLGQELPPALQKRLGDRPDMKL